MFRALMTHSLLTFTFLTINIQPTLSLPTTRRRLAIRQYEGLEESLPNRFLVTLKPDTSKLDVINSLGLSSSSSIIGDWGVIHGFSVFFDDEEEDKELVDRLLGHPDIEAVEEDGIVRVEATQLDAPWGIARLGVQEALSRRNPNSLSFKYTYDSLATGDGVDIYIVDTGVLTSHQEFGGRAQWGVTICDGGDTDTNGHGTFVAAIAAGARYGVAKSANIIAVKVMNSEATGALTDIISGLDWVYQHAQRSARPSVVNLSIGGGISNAFDSAVQKLVSSGVHVIASAGNSNTDANTQSPARLSSVITVGATTIADEKAPFSNYGSAVDVWAPGANILSAWVGSDTAWAKKHGTSMAAPHVTGLVAKVISGHGNMGTREMQSAVKGMALNGVVGGIPGGTRNNLAHI